MKPWPEPKSLQDIQVFIGFANFNRRSIQAFSRIAVPLTLILKSSSTSYESQPGKVVDEVDDEDGGENGSGSGGISPEIIILLPGVFMHYIDYIIIPVSKFSSA